MDRNLASSPAKPVNTGGNQIRDTIAVFLIIVAFVIILLVIHFTIFVVVHKVAEAVISNEYLLGLITTMIVSMIFNSMFGAKPAEDDRRIKENQKEARYIVVSIVDGTIQWLAYVFQ